MKKVGGQNSSNIHVELTMFNIILCETGGIEQVDIYLLANCIQTLHNTWETPLGITLQVSAGIHVLVTLHVAFLGCLHFWRPRQIFSHLISAEILKA